MLGLYHFSLWTYILVLVVLHFLLHQKCMLIAFDAWSASLHFMDVSPRLSGFVILLHIKSVCTILLILEMSIFTLCMYHHKRFA